MLQSARVLVFARKFAACTLVSVRADAGLYLFILSYTLCGLLFVRAVGAEDQMAYSVYAARWPIVFGILFPVLALLVDLIHIERRCDRRRPLAISRVLSVQRLAHFAAGILLLETMLFFQGTFPR
jgi:hypothetical protein